MESGDTQQERNFGELSLFVFFSLSRLSQTLGFFFPFGEEEGRGTAKPKKSKTFCLLRRRRPPFLSLSLSSRVGDSKRRKEEEEDIV